MGIDPVNRDRTWLLPPTIDELISPDHPARFVGAFVQALTRADWAALEIAPEGEPLGRPAYDPRALLCVWLYGFMVGIRSSRKLETACRDQFPFLWLTGWQHPDHNTLWRFYQAHRQQMRLLLKRTVRVAVKAGLVDLAVQAVDGTKVKGNSAKERTFNQTGLQKLLDRTEVAIRDLEAQNTSGGDPPPPRIPRQLAEKQTLRDQVENALDQVRAEDGEAPVNLTDPDANLMKSRQGFVAGYNAQAMVSALAPEAGVSGLFITAVEVSTGPADQDQLVPMIAQAEENTEHAAAVTLADGGYHSGPNLVRCAEQGYLVIMPESNRPAGKSDQLYTRDAFRYCPESDSYVCPEGQRLDLVREKQRPGRSPSRVYRATRAICLACPAFGKCTQDKRHGRTLEIGPQDEVLRAHRTWIATDEARAAYRQRKQLPEPTFGILKEQQDARRFLLRGTTNVRAEWSLLATAFNLRALCKVWRTWAGDGAFTQGSLTGAAAA